MVASHRPARPQAIVVKPARSWQKRKPAAKAHCVVCGCELRGDHALGDLVCDSHPRDGYNPRHDPALDERILLLLWRARGAPLNLYRALGCDPVKTNYDAVDDAVERLERSALVNVVGAGSCGRRLAEIGRRVGGKLRA